MSSLTPELLAVEALIEQEKTLGRLHSGVPSNIGGSPSASIEARRLMAQLLGSRAPAKVDVYQPPPPDWTANQEVARQSQQFQQIARDTYGQRASESIDEAISRHNPSSVDDALLRQRQNTLADIQQLNRQRGVPAINGGGSPSSIDQAPGLRTPETSGLRAPTQATDLPRSAQPSTWKAPTPTLEAEIPTPLNIGRHPTAPPTNVPEPIGLPRGALRAGAIGAGIDFGLRLASGQDVGQAAAGASGSFIGTLAGSAAGSLLGPVGTFAGGMIGGFVGGMVADGLFNAIHPPQIGRSPDEFHPLTAPPLNPQFIGGGRHTLYQVNVKMTVINKNQQYSNTIDGGAQVWGPIQGVTLDKRTESWSANVKGGTSGSPNVQSVVSACSIAGENIEADGFTYGTAFITSVFPLDGGELGSSPQTPQRIEPNFSHISPASGAAHPLNSPLTSYAPNPTPDRGGRPTGDNPLTPRTSQPTPTTQDPAGNPLWVPAARLAPGKTPASKGNLGGNLPQLQSSAHPTAERTASHSSSNRVVSAPTASVVMTGQDLGNGYNESFGQYQARLLSGAATSGGNHQISTDLSPLAQNAIPLAIATTAVLSPQVTGLRPGAPIGAAPGTGSTPSASTSAQPSGSGGAGTGSESNSFQCRFHEDDVSHRKLDEENALMRAIDVAQTTILTRLDSKMGPQLPNGGIAGKLGRMAGLASKTWNFLQIDRALAVFTWIGVLHNAYMLSNSLSQTLFSAISSGLDAIGIQKVDEDGNEEPYDVGEIVQKYTDNYAKSIFGVSTWEGMKSNWKKFNRIYQAAANLLNSIRSITFAMVEMLETISNYTGKIGNALKKSGSILQNSFNWMNPNSNYTNNRFFNALNNTREAVEVIEEITSTVVDIQEQAREASDQKDEFDKALEDGVKVVKEAETKSRADSSKPSVTITPLDEKKAD